MIIYDIRQFLILNLGCFVKTVITIRNGIYIVKLKKLQMNGISKVRKIHASLLKCFSACVIRGNVVYCWYDGRYSIWVGSKCQKVLTHIINQ